MCYFTVFIRIKLYIPNEERRMKNYILLTLLKNPEGQLKNINLLTNSLKLLGLEQLANFVVL
jgi:hypothetical protein